MEQIERQIRSLSIPYPQRHLLEQEIKQDIESALSDKPVVDPHIAEKDCIKSGKRKKRYCDRLTPEMERLLEVKRIVEAWEIEKLDEYYARLKAITDRCESRMRNQQTSVAASSDLDRNADKPAGTTTRP